MQHIIFLCEIKKEGFLLYIIVKIPVIFYFIPASIYNISRYFPCLLTESVYQVNIILSN
jgi:hypothetical protein